MKRNRGQMTLEKVQNYKSLTWSWMDMAIEHVLPWAKSHNRPLYSQMKRLIKLSKKKLRKEQATRSKS